jgi:hypothetical protein
MIYYVHAKWPILILQLTELALIRFKRVSDRNMWKEKFGKISEPRKYSVLEPNVRSGKTMKTHVIQFNE